MQFSVISLKLILFNWWSISELSPPICSGCKSEWHFDINQYKNAQYIKTLRLHYTPTVNFRVEHAWENRLSTMHFSAGIDFLSSRHLFPIHAFRSKFWKMQSTNHIHDIHNCLDFPSSSSIVFASLPEFPNTNTLHHLEMSCWFLYWAEDEFPFKSTQTIIPEPIAFCSIPRH